MKAAIYTGTRNLYANMTTAVKSLICNSDVDVVYLGIEDKVFPYELPPLCKTIDLSGQGIFSPQGANYNSRWSYMMLMRAALVKILPDNLERVLSLDCDTIVDDDISDLWDLPIDGCYFAAAHEWHKTTKNFLYTNVGVSLHNLAKLRDGKADQIIHALEKVKFEFPEQDAMNLMCQGFIYDMPSAYNSLYYTEKVEKPKVIHHIGSNVLFPMYSDVKKYAAMSFGDVMAKRQKA